MSIDLSREPAIALNDVPNLAWLPRRREGKRWHIATIYRWMKHGIRGRRLEYVQVGGARYTTLKALMRFFGGQAEQNSESRREREADGTLAVGV